MQLSDIILESQLEEEVVPVFAPAFAYGFTHQLFVMVSLGPLCTNFQLYENYCGLKCVFWQHYQQITSSSK